MSKFGLVNWTAEEEVFNQNCPQVCNAGSLLGSIVVLPLRASPPGLCR